jgi:omega-amidase
VLPGHSVGVRSLARSLTVGSFQSAASGDIASNLAALERGIMRASHGGLRLLLTQECGLCGYPPLERDTITSVDQQAQLDALGHLSVSAKRHDLFVVVGLITAHGPGFLNSVCFVSPDGTTGQMYHKRALWGWDTENYVPGDAQGVYEVDGIRIGLRICYEVRFPEYFRELFQERVDLALVALANVGEPPHRGQRDVYKSHLVCRASENAMWVLSANSTSRAQLAPSCLVDPDGEITAECRADQEDMLAAVISIGEPSFSTRGRIALSRALNGMEQADVPAAQRTTDGRPQHDASHGPGTAGVAPGQ